MAGDNDIVGGGVEKRPVNRETLSLIRRVVLEEAERLGIRVERIILFGSRARGEAREDSDWDILIVVSEDASPQALKRLRRSLYLRLSIPVDVITVKRSYWMKYRESPGTIAYEAMREGVPIA